MSYGPYNFEKVQYIANQTKIPAKNLNEIQDAVIRNSNNILDIGNRLEDINTMTFKGVLGPDDITELPTKDVKTGDTYVVKEAGQYNNQDSKPKDMFIASIITDSSDGSYTINWNYIPSGDDGDVSAFGTLDEGAIIIGNNGKEIKTLTNGLDNQILKIVDGKPKWVENTLIIKDGSITNAKLANDSVTEEKLNTDIKEKINAKED